MTLEQMQAALERAKREGQTGMMIYWQALIDEMLAKKKIFSPDDD